LEIDSCNLGRASEFKKTQDYSTKFEKPLLFFEIAKITGIVSLLAMSNDAEI
jgi:hypothetical protein